jgi:UDP-N-acetylmuramyl pentapeptide phosphotransferase/UDP-N-acetylglucosamine-1-phosphate transferase
MNIVSFLFFAKVFVLSCISFVLVFFFQKKKILLDNISYSTHKQLTCSKQITSTGGLLFFFYIFFFIKNLLLLKFFLTLFLIFGILSDKNIINNPIIKFIFLLLLIIFLVIFVNLKINSISINQLNFLLANQYFNIFFTAFCISIILNGTNFIDGLNGLSGGYYLIINLSLLMLVKQAELDINYINLEISFLIICATVIPNTLGKSFFGDNGVFVVSVYYSFVLIDFHMNNPLVSPLYIALLLWYPAFENLFSIIRKLLINKSPLMPDNQHLHQLLYIYIMKNIQNKSFNNFFSALPILLFNFIVLIIGSNYIFDTKALVFLLFLNIFIYLIAYRILFVSLYK